MSEAKALDPLPDELRSSLVSYVRASKLVIAHAREWLDTQSVGPDKRQFHSTIQVLARDALLLEQYLAREIVRKP